MIRRWRLLPLLLLFAAGAGAPVRADSKEPTPVVHETSLPNGLRVVVDQAYRVPFVTVVLRYGVGTSMDPAHRIGLAELTMWLMARRTQHVPEDGFADALDRAGASWGYTSNADATEFYATLPSNSIELAMWLFSEGMGFFTPAIDQRAIENRVSVMNNERAQRVEDLNTAVVSEQLPKELYPEGHPYRHSQLGGDASQMSGVTVAEVSAFAQRWFVPSNAVLVVAGDAREQEVESLAQKYFGPIPAGHVNAPASPPVPPLRGQVTLEVGARVARPSVAMYWPTPPHYADGDADLDLVADMLRGGRVAKLSWELIGTRKVASSVYARQRSAEHGSTFIITAVTAPGHGNQEVTNAIDDVLRTLQANDPSDDDLAGSAAQLLTPRILGFERAQVRARQYAEWAIATGVVDYLREDLGRYESTPARVRAAAQKYLPLDRRVVVFTEPDATAPPGGIIRNRQLKAAP